MTKSAAIEALEVGIIIITIGSASGAWYESLSGAGLALLLTFAIVIWLHGHLLQVPDVFIKLSAGIIMMSFGTFWLGEGSGFDWPLGELMLLFLIGLYGAVSWATIRWLQTRQQSN